MNVETFRAGFAGGIQPSGSAYLDFAAPKLDVVLISKFSFKVLTFFSFSLYSEQHSPPRGKCKVSASPSTASLAAAGSDPDFVSDETLWRIRE